MLHSIKLVVVDEDVAPFNEEEVMWSVATQVLADEDADIRRVIDAVIY